MMSRRNTIHAERALSRRPTAWLMTALMVLFTATAARADGGGVSFSRNRIIFPAQDGAVTLTVNNHGDQPWLVQAGVSAEPMKRTAAPFIVTPPLFRLEGNGQNVMRILRAGGSLPADRESVFYFYASTIPSQPAPKPGQVVQGQLGASLSISMRTILKLFWRPAGLAITPKAAPGMMQFTVQPGAVVVKNPTPYYQSFALLKFDGREQNLDKGPSMVAPFSELRFPASQSVKAVSWSVMNDYGGTTDVATTPLGGGRRAAAK
ncbi:MULTISPECIES: fimbrial biogenesis chaperone [unclassified Erwinia]|uniref:fimbrial biogenesis chaperone n=1 Tax=unclassified Erwinia TaxID=2622719 RepID=UPI0013046A8E|nr:MULTISPECIES: molecular chaperone [unclassified Erwinia]